MTEDQNFPEHAEEIEQLRSRVLEFERLLVDTRDRGPSSGSAPAGAAVSSKVLADEALEGFFDQSSAMMFVADLVEGRFLRINQKVCDVIGATEQEILESSFLDRVHPDDHLRTMREMERLVAGEQSTNFRNRHRDSDGNYRVFDWTAVVDPDRELCYAMAVEVPEL